MEIYKPSFTPAVPTLARKISAGLGSCRYPHPDSGGWCRSKCASTLCPCWGSLYSKLEILKSQCLPPTEPQPCPLPQSLDLRSRGWISTSRGWKMRSWVTRGGGGVLGEKEESTPYIWISYFWVLNSSHFISLSPLCRSPINIINPSY